MASTVGGLGRDIAKRSLLADSCPDAITILGLVRQYDCSGADMIEQVVSGLAVKSLTSSQAQPDRKALPIDGRMDFGGEPTSGATEIMIPPPLWPSRPVGTP